MSTPRRLAEVAAEGDPAAVADVLRRQGVRLLAMTMVDNAGVTRVKVVPAARIERAAERGVGMSTVWVTAAVDDHFAPSPPYDSPVGDLRLVPDLRGARILPAPGWGWAPVDQRTQELETEPACQRSILRRVAERAAAAGFDFRVAYETEMTLLDADGAPAHCGPGYSAPALGPLEEFAVDLVDALGEAGVDVDQLHPEYTPGQFEVSVAARDPVTAADEVVLIRIATRQVARRHGLRVSFAPVVFPGAVGNGSHIHLSAWRDGENLMQGGDRPAGLTAPAAAMVAGLETALPGLMAVLAPGVASYGRLEPHHWAGVFACWGVENREAALRFVPGTVTGRAESANLEVKSLDAGANPYLAAAVLLAAALEGADAGAELRDPVQRDPGTLSDEERQVRGIRRLPTSLPEATDLFEESAVARRALGDDLHRAIVAVRRLEWKNHGERPPDELAEVYRWAY